MGLRSDRGQANWCHCKQFPRYFVATLRKIRQESLETALPVGDRPDAVIQRSSLQVAKRAFWH